MTGFPLEQILALRSPSIADACDGALRSEQALADAASELLRVAAEAGSAGDGIRKRVHAGRSVEFSTEGLSPSVLQAIEAHRAALDGVQRAMAALEATYGPALDVVRRRLYATAREERFRHALLLSSPSLESLSNPPDPDGPLPERNKEWRRREETWASYLQRFTMKNETISFFGPSVWGTTERSNPVSVDIELDDAWIDRRVVYFERGTCDAIAAKIASETPDFPPGELPISHKPFDELRARIEQLPATECRTTWLARLSELEAVRARFEAHPTLEDRRPLLEQFDALFAQWGIERDPGKGLYAARLPVNEDCNRAVRTNLIGRAFIEQAEADLAPWYELWRDLAGLYMSRLEKRLAAIHGTLPSRPRLNEFLSAASKAGLPIDQSGGVGHMPELDLEIQTAWQEEIASRAELAEVELTERDLSFVRRRFQFRRMADYDVPAPDFHLAARDRIAAREGRGTIILGEVHPDHSMWAFGGTVFCPDLEDRVKEYRATHGPALLWGRHLERAAHTTLPRAAMGHWSACVPFGPSGVPQWRTDELFVERTADDFVVRTSEGKVLGSLINNWAVAMNTHRIEFFGTGPHSPRLRVGRVIVQRESWLVQPDERIRDAVERSGPKLLLGIRRLQHAFRLPREVFLRPVLSLRISRHKDAKPVFVDFDNPFSAEMLAALVRKFLQFRISEILPRVEDCWLSDSLGHYCSEFRMVAHPSDCANRGLGVTASTGSDVR